MNVLIYARVSTDKQADKALSIPAQVQAMRDYAGQREWSVIEEFIEPGASAKTTNRPSLQNLLSRIRERRDKIDVVLIHKIDRLARNVYDYATIKAFLLENGVRLVSVVENADDTISGQLVENIMASIAQFYSANLGEEVRKGMRQRVLNGGWPHKPPRGYRSTTRADGRDHNMVEIDEVDGPPIRAAFEFYAQGTASFRDVAGLLADAGVKARTGYPFSPDRVRRMLSNPFYAGRIKWADLDVAAEHEAVVPPALFDLVQRTIKERGEAPTAKGPVNGFPLRGLAVCAFCRSRMTASWQRSGNGRRFGYYKCSRRMYNKALCPNRSSTPAAAAHEQVRELCASLRIPEGTLNQVRAMTDRLLSTERSVESGKQADESQLAEGGQRTAALTADFISGKISSESYRATVTLVKQRQRDLKAAAQNESMNAPRTRDEVDRLLKDIRTIGDASSCLTDDRQRQLLHGVFSCIVLEPGGELGFTLRPPFDGMLSIP